MIRDQARTVTTLHAAIVSALAVTACSASGGGGPSDDDCNAPPMDLAACATDDDCTTVAAGCYCGAQPVTGVALVHATTAAACETTAANTCALGCANLPGYLAQDGMHADSTAMIQVRCEPATSTCTTYVP